MAKTAKDPEQKEVKPFEDRIEDIAIEQFEALGYTGRLPDSLVETYKAVKSRKDRIHPGPLSPEGIVMVLFLAGFINKELQIWPSQPSQLHLPSSKKP